MLRKDKIRRKENQPEPTKTYVLSPVVKSAWQAVCRGENQLFRLQLLAVFSIIFAS